MILFHSRNKQSVRSYCTVVACTFHICDQTTVAINAGMYNKFPMNEFVMGICDINKKKSLKTTMYNFVYMKRKYGQGAYHRRGQGVEWVGGIW